MVSCLGCAVKRAGIFYKAFRLRLLVPSLPLVRPRVAQPMLVKVVAARNAAT
jgi:hypothetical protein